MVLTIKEVAKLDMEVVMVVVVVKVIQEKATIDTMIGEPRLVPKTVKDGQRNMASTYGIGATFTDVGDSI